MADIVLKNILKVYDKDVVAVQDFNLEIADKEFVVFVGPSGCGKSTTLRMIAGLEDISGGELYIGGKLMNDVLPKDRDIAMVFQNYALYPHMNAYENMAFALTLKKVPKNEIDKRVKNAAEILNITEYLDRKPKALSGGQRQRVAIGRAIVREPKAFLMDEPLSNLDAKLRNSMRAELIKLRKKLNSTFVYVTHDQTEAMTLGDRIVIMKDGVIQQIGTPGEVFDHPHNMFVGGFIGSPQMNMIHGCDLVVEEGRYFLRVFGEDYLLPEDFQDGLFKKQIGGRRVVAGIRAEDISLAVDDTAPYALSKIDVTEAMGAEMIVHMSVMGEYMAMKITRHDMMNQLERYFNTQGEVRITFDVGRFHIFDEETESNLLFG